MSAVRSASKCTNTDSSTTNLVFDFRIARSELCPTDFTSQSSSETAQVTYDIDKHDARFAFQ
jgi:hypothetical protein